MKQLSLLVLVPLTGCFWFDDFPHHDDSGLGIDGDVFAMTNDADKNEVVSLERASDDHLELLTSVSTKGDGLGLVELPLLAKDDGIDPLVSESSLHLMDDDTLIAANAGSGSITVLYQGMAGLRAGDEISVGAYPNTIDSQGDLVFVGLSPGTDAEGGVAVLQWNGSELEHVSTLALSAPDAHPARVLATDDYLFVSEVLNNIIDVYSLRSGGTPLAGDEIGPGTTVASAGVGPFGMATFGDHYLFVAEAGPPDTEGQSSISTYDIGKDGSLTPVTSALMNGQTATCWVQITGDDSTAYTSNTASGTITRYTLYADGTAEIANAVEDTPGGAPIDMDLDRGSDRLFVLLGGTGAIAQYEVGTDGTLTRDAIHEDVGLPMLGSQGLQAR